MTALETDIVIVGGGPVGLMCSYLGQLCGLRTLVIETSGELVRSTKYSDQGTHAQDYVSIVQKRAGYITGMGIRYQNKNLDGTRLFDFPLYEGAFETRLYSLLDYSKFTLLIFGEDAIEVDLYPFLKVIQIHPQKRDKGYWSTSCPYLNQAILVRPDSYIESSTTLTNKHLYKKWLESFLNQ